MKYSDIIFAGKRGVAARKGQVVTKHEYIEHIEDFLDDVDAEYDAANMERAVHDWVDANALIYDEDVVEWFSEHRHDTRFHIGALKDYDQAWITGTDMMDIMRAAYSYQAATAMMAVIYERIRALRTPK